VNDRRPDLNLGRLAALAMRLQPRPFFTFSPNGPRTDTQNLPDRSVKARSPAKGGSSRLSIVRPSAMQLRHNTTTSAPLRVSPAHGTVHPVRASPRRATYAVEGRSQG
jgi:hypothetical protein